MMKAMSELFMKN
jgi:hypothetical protein